MENKYFTTSGNMYISWLPLIIIVAIIAVFMILQVYLSKRTSKMPGAILPVAFFVFSVIASISSAQSSLPIQPSNLLVFLLLCNIPTAILLIVYFVVRGKNGKEVKH